MVPMHDGAKMETVIIAPKGAAKLPILFQRTPYGVPGALPPQLPGSWKPLVADGYIFVFQSMRGRFGSDGKFTLSTSVKTSPNEATDAYDSIAWLVKNVPNNNGKVGMWGVSYPASPPRSRSPSRIRRSRRSARRRRGSIIGCRTTSTATARCGSATRPNGSTASRTTRRRTRN